MKFLRIASEVRRQVFPSSATQVLVRDQFKFRGGVLYQSNGRTKYTMSYVHGNSHFAKTPALLGKTIGQVVDEAVEKWPDEEFVVFCEDNQRLTYRQLGEQSSRLAAGLLALGVKRGDRVGIWSPNKLEWILTQYATAQIGAVLVNLNPSYRQGEILFALNKVGVKALVTAASFKTQDYYGMLTEICPEIQTSSPGRIKSNSLPQMESLVVFDEGGPFPGSFSVDDVMDLGTRDHYDMIDDVKKGLQFDDIINIQFTSGTTGAPKATTLTHFNLLNNVHVLGHLVDFDEIKVSCIPVPLFHIFGMTVGSLMSMLYGTKTVFPSASFDPGATIRAIHDERCMFVPGVPTMFIAMLHHPDLKDFDLSSWRLTLAGGSPVPEQTLRDMRNLIGVKHVVPGFGMTELGLAACVGHLDDPEINLLTTVGRPMPWSEIKIVHPSTGAVVPVNEPGELCCRSPYVMPGYWDDPENTAKTIDAAKWLHTGDVATVDEDGYVKIVGRIKDMIIRGGENIYPVEIEELLHKHPKIEDAQVIGIPDELMGEELCACVKLKAGESLEEEEISEFCKGKISHFKIPRYIHVVNEFPLTVTGKVQKYVLREEMEKARENPNHAE